jgi:hypothetical protein
MSQKTNGNIHHSNCHFYATIFNPINQKNKVKANIINHRLMTKTSDLFFSFEPDKTSANLCSQLADISKYEFLFANERIIRTRVLLIWKKKKKKIAYAWDIMKNKRSLIIMMITWTKKKKNYRDFRVHL